MRREKMPAPSWQEPTKREAIEIELQLITPMFGGGYRTREVDPLMPIRPAAIRGHLRFWWRATAGAQYSSAKELYKAETAIWGGAAMNDDTSFGRVAIRVELKNQGKSAPYSEIAPSSTRRDGPLQGYFLFPFQEQRGGTPAADGRKEITFRLSIDLDPTLSEQQKEELRTALKAWVAFGGVGARTRRGCGALKAIGPNAQEWLVPNEQDQIRAWLTRLIPNASEQREPAVKPSLVGARILFVLNNGDAMDIWSKLGRFWARFRKGHFKRGSTEDYQPMRGAKWDDYRKVLCKLSSQSEVLKLAKPYLGLPIIYQEFRGANRPCFTGTIEPSNSGRMASPVILKPVALTGGKVGGIVLVLNAQEPTYITVNGKKYKLELPSTDPVLQDLEASTVMDAVIKAAEIHFGNHSKAICIGGRV